MINCGKVKCGEDTLVREELQSSNGVSMEAA